MIKYCKITSQEAKLLINVLGFDFIAPNVVTYGQYQIFKDTDQFKKISWDKKQFLPISELNSKI